MTRVAFSLWNERIAPVFDVARQLWIADAVDNAFYEQTSRRFSTDDPQERALRLATLNVEQLVCGAITKGAYEALVDKGIQVFSFVAGDVEQVMQAWLTNHLSDEHLAMPGCNRGKRHGMRRHSCRNQSSDFKERS